MRDESFTIPGYFLETLRNILRNLGDLRSRAEIPALQTNDRKDTGYQKAGCSIDRGASCFMNVRCHRTFTWRVYNRLVSK